MVRSRRSLVATAAKWFGFAVLSAIVGTILDGTGADWLSELMVYPAGIGVGWGLVNICRALLPERWRQASSRREPSEEMSDPGPT